MPDDDPFAPTRYLAAKRAERAGDEREAVEVVRDQPAVQEYAIGVDRDAR
jgi:hypothetical protein